MQRPQIAAFLFALTGCYSPGEEASTGAPTATDGAQTEGPPSYATDTDSSTSNGPVDSGDESDGSTAASTGAPTDAGVPTADTPIDVLFVIDNSSTMGAEQAKIAQGATTLVDALVEAGGDVRVGVTTTDLGNPLCVTELDGGSLIADSCTNRLDRFIFLGSTNIDATALACTDLCQLESLPIEETATHVDAMPAPRPWLERSSAGTNLEAGTDFDAALSCMLPQGINGCGFESPLEAAARVLATSDDPASPNYGFLRPDATLAVVIVTDDVDCSTQMPEIFDPEGDPVFWDIDAGFPTKAVCWNAGVQCIGGGMAYERCDPVDLGLQGAETSPEEAVLVSVTSYAGLFSERSAVIAAFAGVPLGYSAGDEIPYSISEDPEHEHSTGIFPACASAGGEGVPPVRLRAVVESTALGEPQLFSICEDDYAPDLVRLAETIIGAAE